MIMALRSSPGGHTSPPKRSRGAFKTSARCPRRLPRAPKRSPRAPQNVFKGIFGSQKPEQEAKESPKGRAVNDWQRFGVSLEVQKGPQETPLSTQMEAKRAPRRFQDHLRIKNVDPTIILRFLRSEGHHGSSTSTRRGPKRRETTTSKKLEQEEARRRDKKKAKGAQKVARSTIVSG